MALLTHVNTIKQEYKILTGLYKKQETEYKSSTQALAKEVGDWKALIKSFNAGLSKNIYALEKTKPEKRSAKIDDLWKTTDKYKQKINQLSKEGYAESGGSMLLKILKQIEDALGPLQANPQDPKGKYLKPLLTQADRWSEGKKKAEEAFLKYIKQENAEGAKGLGKFQKDVKPLLTALSSKALDAFAKFDGVDGEAKKKLAAKLLEVHKALNKAFGKFANSETAMGLSDRVNGLQQPLDEIQKELNQAME